MNNCETLNIKGDALTSLINFVKASNIIDDLLGSLQGFIGLDSKDIYEFVKNAKEIRAQTCTISDISSKYQESDNMSETQIKELRENIKNELLKEFSKEGIDIKTKANRRIIIVGVTPATTLRMLDCIFDILGKDIKHQQATNNSRVDYGKIPLKITMLDIYE